MRWVLAAVLLIAGCGEPEPEAELEAAACSDLDGDASMYQVIASAVDFYSDRPNPQFATAKFLDEAIRDKCPQHLELWEENILYEDWIAPAE